MGRRSADNLIVTSGLALLATGLNYALTLSEDAAWGNPYSPPVGAVYAAMGTDSTPASAGQTALGAEVGRALVSNASVSGAALSYDFFVPTSLGNGVITELGTFGAAGYAAPLLTAALTSGSVYTALTVGGVTSVIPASSTLTLGYGTGTTQTVTTTAQANIGDTSIAVSSFTASAAFGAGTLAAYTPGTLIDRAVLASPLTKTAAQTATVNLSLTLASA